MGKLVIKSAKDFQAAMKTSREAATDTARIVRAHARQIDYDDKIARLQKNIGSKVKSIMSAFERLNKAVVKKVGNTNLTAVQIITPEVVSDIMLPYSKFLASFGDAKTITDAVNFLEAKRELELKSYGKTEMLKDKINTYFDLRINKYLLPLQQIEVQINELNDKLGYKGNKINFLSSKKKSIPQPKTIEVTEVTQSTEQTIG